MAFSSFIFWYQNLHKYYLESYCMIMIIKMLKKAGTQSAIAFSCDTLTNGITYDCNADQP